MLRFNVVQPNILLNPEVFPPSFIFCYWNTKPIVHEYVLPKAFCRAGIVENTDYYYWTDGQTGLDFTNRFARAYHLPYRKYPVDLRCKPVENGEVTMGGTENGE